MKQFKIIVRDGKKIRHEDLGGGLLRPAPGSDNETALAPDYKDGLAVIGMVLGKVQSVSAPDPVKVFWRLSDSMPTFMMGGGYKYRGFK